MTLREKLQEEPVYINAYSFKLTKESAEQFEKIAEEFAIGFAEWCDNKGYTQVLNSFWKSLNDEKGKSTEELLEIYKIEKGL